MEGWGGVQGDLLEDRYKVSKGLNEACHMGMQQRCHCYKGHCKEEDEKEKHKWQGDDLNMNLQVRSSSPCTHSH